MLAIKAHYDGKVLVPDEPLDLPPGRRVIVHVSDAAAPEAGIDADATPRRRREVKLGTAEGQGWMADDFDAPLEDFKDYM